MYTDLVAVHMMKSPNKPSSWCDSSQCQLAISWLLRPKMATTNYTVVNKITYCLPGLQYSAASTQGVKSMSYPPSVKSEELWMMNNQSHQSAGSWQHDQKRLVTRKPFVLKSSSYATQWNPEEARKTSRLKSYCFQDYSLLSSVADCWLRSQG